MSYNEEMKKFNQNIPESSDKRDCSTCEHCVDYEMRFGMLRACEVWNCHYIKKGENNETNK